MKYTITVNQSALFNNGLVYKTDWIEWFIIDYLKDFVIYKKSKRVIYKNEEYIWLNYNHLIVSLPCIKLVSKSAISKRISRLERLGMIKTLRAKDNTLYYTFTDKLIDICFNRKTDMDRLKRANPGMSDNKSYPHLKDPVLRRETPPVLARRTAQYNTNISIKNKDYNNNDISFSSSLKQKTEDCHRDTENTEKKVIEPLKILKIQNITQRINTDNNDNELKPNSPEKNPVNPVKKEIKGFSTLSGVWKVLENIRQRGVITTKIGKQENMKKKVIIDKEELMIAGKNNIDGI